MKMKKMALLAMMMTTGIISATGANGISAVHAAAPQTQSADGIYFMGASDLQERKVETAKSPNANPFGLVYDGAITKNEAAKSIFILSATA